MTNTTTFVVNLRRAAYDVYIGRAGQGKDGFFGNPFPMKTEADRAQVMAQYLEYFARRLQTDTHFRTRVLELRGKTLGRFCKPAACHGDVIAFYLNNLSEDAFKEAR